METTVNFGWTWMAAGSQSHADSNEGSQGAMPSESHAKNQKTDALRGSEGEELAMLEETTDALMHSSVSWQKVRCPAQR